MNTWEETILRGVHSLGGRATVGEIRDKVGESHLLTEDHLRRSGYGDYPKYYDEVRAFVNNLRKSDCLKRVKRGLYELTDKGRRRIGV